MDASLFIEQVRLNFPGVAARVVQNLNSTTNPNINRTYRHLTMLRKEFSPDLKWQSLTTVNGSAVAADVIAMDSSIPLKMRDSLGGATGDVPKIAMEMALREKQLSDLDIISRTPNQNAQLLAKLFNDTVRCITGVYERLEYMFLQGLSTGITTHIDPQNVGVGVRIDYGYLTANRFSVFDEWVGNPTTATPITDLAVAQAKAQADGNIITRWLMDRATFNAMIATNQVKQEVAAALGFFGSTIPLPSASQVNNALQSKYGYTVEIIERSIVTEKDGVRTTRIPWGAGQVIGLSDSTVGSLTWGTLAEVIHPVPNVTYTTVQDYILVSKFRMNRPSLAEFTNSQALVIPVIDNVAGIYVVDAATAG